VIPKGKMCVFGIKAQKISFLTAKSISSPSLKNMQMQLFCTSLQPKTKQGQGADLPNQVQNHFSTLAFAASHVLTPPATWLQPQA